MNIVFFDGDCDFCRKMIHYLSKQDRKKRLFFAPLQGKTAKKHHITETTSILFLEENGKLWKRSKALSKIFIQLEKPLLSRVFLLPGADRVYRWVARHRKSLSSLSRKKIGTSDRFLP